MSESRTARQAAKQKALAYHEAGHAVVAHVLDLRFTAVTIVPNEKYQGCLRIDPAHWKCWNLPGGLDGLTREQAERQILVLLSGLPAERLANPEAKPSCSRHDELQGRFLAEEILGHPAAYTNRATDRAWKQTVASYLNTMRLCSEQIIHYYRRAVRVLAKALLEEGEIEANRVEEIIAGAIPKPMRAPAIIRLGMADFSPQEVAGAPSANRGIVIRHRTTGQILLRHDTEAFLNVDLRGLNLQGANLAGLTFRGAASLEGAGLRQSDLRGTKLHYGRLEEATLAEADLRGASLYAANLKRADLSRADLQGAELNYADLEQAVLVSAALAGASLWGANLSGANLSRANMAGATLRKAKLEGACLCDAVLIGSDLRGASLQGTDLISDPKGIGARRYVGAIYDQSTQWPEGFDPQQHGAVLRDQPPDSRTAPGS